MKMSFWRVLSCVVVMLALGAGQGCQRPGEPGVVDAGAQDLPGDAGAMVVDAARDEPVVDASDAEPADDGGPVVFDGCDSCTAAAPLAERSPWPKFRGNMAQTGRSDLLPRLDGGALWTVQTGKGIFSSPVVAADGTIYVGSADRTFYAISPEGDVRFEVETGEIIDSAALLDDRGRVYFGSGDGHLRALDAETGEVLWSFAADAPDSLGSLINWFEGNVAIGVDGRLLVPNDNFAVYGVDRESGELAWRWLMNDQTWSSPAVDRETGRLFIGNNYIAPLDIVGAFYKNIFALNADGTMLWRTGVQATVAASPMLANDHLYFGAFDGFLRALNASDGSEDWTLGARDHLYASAARLSDGTIIQPSTDGTVYAVDPDNGAVLWAYDTPAPVRSSPAVDGRDVIYFGGGDGRLYALNPNGTRRFSMQLIDEDRNDLNASPALGLESLYLAGENGAIFSVPYDYCLRPVARGDVRCELSPGEDLPDAGARLRFVTPFGTTLPSAPKRIEANRALALALEVRANGDSLLALLDEESLKVRVLPEQAVAVEISGDQRFVTIVPNPSFTGTQVSVEVSGAYRVDPDRDGLRLTGGRIAGRFDETFTFALDVGDQPPAFDVPFAGRGASAQFELKRTAVPLPTILPSYNQIGFDSLHYLVGWVDDLGDHEIGWVVGGRLDDDGQTLPDPETQVLFPVTIHRRGGLLTLANQAGFTVNAMNADVPFDSFRVSARLDASGNPTGERTLHVTTDCGEIPIYGSFLVQLGFCHPTTESLTAYGSLDVVRRPSLSPPQNVGQPAFAIERGGLFSEDRVTVRLPDGQVPASAHSTGILLVDVRTGEPLALQYGLKTERKADDAGFLREVSVVLPRGVRATDLRAYFMVDTYPAATATLAYR